MDSFFKEPMDINSVMTVTQAAQRLGISGSAIRSYIKLAGIPTKSVGGTTVFSETQLDLLQKIKAKNADISKTVGTKNLKKAREEGRTQVTSGLSRSGPLAQLERIEQQLNKLVEALTSPSDNRY